MKFYRNVVGHMGDAHRADLQRAVLATQDIPGDLLEVGSFNGLSALMTLAVLHEAKKLISVDIGAHDLLKNLALYRVEDLVEINTDGFEDYAQKHPDRTYSHVFIDHDHSYETNKRALALFWPGINPGGILTCHDYGHESFPGVKTAVDEFEAGPKAVAFKRGWTVSFVKPPWLSLSAVREHPSYVSLRDAYSLPFGTLLEKHSDESIQRQMTILNWLYQRAGSPKQVLEAGTAKGFFGLVLRLLRDDVELTTIDASATSSISAAILSKIMAIRYLGCSTDEAFTLIPKESSFGLAWIDADHTFKSVLADVVNCQCLGVDVIVLDDCNLAEVARAFETVLSQNARYKKVVIPLPQGEKQIWAMQKCRE